MSKKNKLQDLFEKQKEFQIALNKNLGKVLKSDRISVTREELQNITKETILQIFSETNEILSEINWKTHKNQFEINEDKIKEEIIDNFIFNINLALTWGMNSEEFYNLCLKKINKNFERFVKN